MTFGLINGSKTVEKKGSVVGTISSLVRKSVGNDALPPRGTLEINGRDCYLESNRYRNQDLDPTFRFNLGLQTEGSLDTEELSREINEYIDSQTLVRLDYVNTRSGFLRSNRTGNVVQRVVPVKLESFVSSE